MIRSCPADAGALMLIDRYAYEDIFARVPEVATQTDPVLRQLDRLLDDDAVYQRVRADLGKRYPLTLVQGRHSTPGEAIVSLPAADDAPGAPEAASLAPPPGGDKAEQRKAVYEMLLAATGATIKQATRIRDALHEIGGEAQGQAQRLVDQLDHSLPLVQQVVSQAERRVLEGRKGPAKEKLASLFEPHTRIIPRHTGGADVEFGRMVVFDEVEGGIITRFAVLEDKTAEQGQLAPALQHHRQLFDRAPRMATGDRGVHAPANERIAWDVGVKHLVIPRSGPVSEAERARERSRSWRRRYRWRAGIEGRVSSLRRDYGLRRCPDPGEDGFTRHLGWGVIASNLRHIGQYLIRKQAA